MLPQALAAAPEVDDVTMVQQAINQRCRHDLGARNDAPLLEAPVGRQRRGDVSAARIDQLEEQHRPGTAHRQAADLVIDQQGRKGRYPQTTRGCTVFDSGNTVGLWTPGGGFHAHVGRGAASRGMDARRPALPGRASRTTPAARDMAENPGIRHCAGLHRDGLFVSAVVSAGGFWLVLWWLLPVQPIGWRQAATYAFLSLVVVQPCLEEVVFRGFVQGWLEKWHRMRAQRLGFTAANGVTALLFAAAHLVYHPPLWAAGVIIPALLFGFFRDRYASILPGMALHVFYNGGYFALTGLPQQMLK